MPLPLILGIGAAVAGVAGIGSGVHGAIKMKGANDVMKAAQSRHANSIQKFESKNQEASANMDRLGQLELEILDSFQRFADVIEKIQNRPQFTSYAKDGVELPEYDPEKLKEVSIGAGVLLGGLGGAAMGTAGGFAAAGATTAAVMALGTASTGTAIASLSGIAATNATLAALGGGALAAGGGGIALGTTILGVATLGAGLLVGGVIFSLTGSSLSNKADEAWEQAEKTRKSVDNICVYLDELNGVASAYTDTLNSVNTIYQKHLTGVTTIVDMLGKTDWNLFTDAEKQLTENSVLLVGLLYSMCKVQLVLKSEGENGLNKVNLPEIQDSTANAEHFLADRALS